MVDNNRMGFVPPRINVWYISSNPHPPKTPSSLQTRLVMNQETGTLEEVVLQKRGMVQHRATR